MVHKDGERLYQKALKTKNAEKEIKLLEQAWELGCLKAGPDLGFYLQTEDEDIDCGSEDFQEEAIRNNVRAYRMMKQALDGGVTDAIGGLKWLTSNIDFTNRKRYGELSSEDPRYFSSQYWEEQELLTDNKTAQLLYGLHLEKTNPIAACWWLTRAAEPGSIERSNALRDIESIKGSNEELPPEARLILNYDLIPLTWPDVLEEPKNSGYNREELRRYYRTAPGPACDSAGQRPGPGAAGSARGLTSSRPRRKKRDDVEPCGIECNILRYPGIIRKIMRTALQNL